MERLRSTFKRSRTPTGAEMKSQSSLEVPKQVRSASFDEIQLEAQRQESKANAELKSIANIAMATSSGSSSHATAVATTNSSSSSSYSPSRSQTADYASGGAMRKFATLRIPQLHQTNQRSKSFDVAATTSLLERSSSSAGTSYGYVARWRSSGERENPPSQAYSCWHCACVDEYKASIGANDSWEEDEGNDSDNDNENDDDDDDDDDNDDDDDDEEDDDAEVDEDEYESGCGEELGQEQNLSVADQYEPPKVQVERDKDNTYYFVVVQKASEEIEDDGSDCSRREGSPEIRVTLTTSSEKTSTVIEPDSLESSDMIRCELLPECRQRRRSLSRQEALTTFPAELPAILGISVSDEGGQSSPEEEEEEEDDDDDDDDDDADNNSDRTCENKAANLVVRDIFLTVPDLKRDRAASVDSCFNNNKNGKIETCYSLAVPQQNVRSKSVDIVLPTEVQTRYTALLPGNEESRAFTG